MDETYEAELFELEETHWWYRGRRRVLRSLVEAHLPHRPGRVLDVGCGTGRNLVELADLGEVRGVEPSMAAVEFGRARDLLVVQGDAVDLPFADASFDLVTALDVIEHIADDVRALSEMRRVVSSTGAAVVTVPAYEWLWSAHDDMNLHQRRYTARLLRSRAEAAGWRIHYVSYFNAALLLPIAAHRRLQRLIGHSSPTDNDFKRTPARLNRLLEGVLAAEANLIGRGVALPAGVSVAAVLRPADLA